MRYVFWYAAGAKMFGSPSTPVLENPEYQTRWYFKYFLGKREYDTLAFFLPLRFLLMFDSLGFSRTCRAPMWLLVDSLGNFVFLNFGLVRGYYAGVFWIFMRALTAGHEV